MKKFIILMITVFLFSLVSCSSSNAVIHNYQNFPEPDKDKGIIYFYRPSKLAAAVAKYIIYLDGKIIAESINGKYSYVMLDPGNYNISMDTKMETAEVSKFDFVLTVEANKKYYIKNEFSAEYWKSVFTPILFYDWSKFFTIHFELVPEEVGEIEIISCEYVTFNFNY